MDEEFSGFMPAIKNIEITNQTSMIATDGSLVNGHIIKIILGDGQEIILSVIEDQLQKLFFLILKILNN
ncbi:hypothetical protein FJZ33_02245 [Candidatus Poribacteria bacterium]|nr:hypothetical protein [Candidatus Poribacteria bacterium]